MPRLLMAFLDILLSLWAVFLAVLLAFALVSLLAMRCPSAARPKLSHSLSVTAAGRLVRTTQAGHCTPVRGVDGINATTQIFTLDFSQHP